MTVPIISALRETLHEPDLPYRFRVPHSLGYFPDLQLLLMEALPGKPFFKELLKTWAGNAPGQRRRKHLPGKRLNDWKRPFGPAP